MPVLTAYMGTHEKRDDGGHSGGASIQIWIPVVVVGIILVLGTLGLCWRRSISAWLGNRRRTRTAVTPATRELTAEQLAGTINGTTPAAAAANRTRRTRRPRRTPSQISTTSLPAYAKEPGEQELVIFRGPEDMEDAGMPAATVVMEPLSEDGEESMHSRNNSQASQYPPIPATPVDAPLLNQNGSSVDLSTQVMPPPGDVMQRRSMDTLNSSEEASSLAPAYDDRGEAPAYFEVVDTISPTELSAPPSSEAVPPRRSGFRTLLNSIPNRLSMYSSSHARADSSFSMVSSENTHNGRERPQSRASHRPSGSGSGSLLHLTPFRTLSRQSNINNLTSPSLISLNSISAPLTHTLSRTEFTYPKSGPTPEQLKLISSRDGFARFAMPYGADAIAFAASASRQDLNDVPPPDFDAPTPGSSGLSRLRTSSDAAELTSEGVSSTSLSQPEAPVEPTANLSTSPLQPEAPPAPTAPRDSSTPLQSEARPESTDESSVPITASSSDTPEVNTVSNPIGTSLSSAVADVAQAQPEIAPLDLPKPSTLAGGPPASLRAPSSFGDYLESRASSVTSFATAVESLASRSPSRSDIASDDNGDDVSETPTTPRIAGHSLEPTDITITQQSSAAGSSN